MIFSRLIRLAWGELGDPPYKNIGVMLCLSFVTAVSMVLASLLLNLGSFAQERITGNIPDIVKVEIVRFSLGPINLEPGIDPAVLKKLASIPGVSSVYRQGRLTRPSSLGASYAGQNFYSDILVEAVDGAFIEKYFNKGRLGTAEQPSQEQKVTPCLLNNSVVEALLSGVSIHTSLPALDSQAIIGRHFTLRIGHSSFSHDTDQPTDVRCQIVGLSPLVGAGGPCLPYETVEKLNGSPLKCSSALVSLEKGADLPAILEAIKKLKLNTPGLELAREVENFLNWTQVGLFVFCLLLTCCAGFALYSNLSLEIRINWKRLRLYQILGAVPSDLVKIYLFRSCVVIVPGIVGGLLVGCLLGGIINKVSAHWLTGSMPLFTSDARIMLGVSGMVFVTGLCFSILPILNFFLSDNSRGQKRN